MTEEVWTLKKKLAATEIALAEAQMQVVSANHAKAKADFEALGEAWVDPDAEQIKSRSDYEPNMKAVA